MKIGFLGCFGSQQLLLGAEAVAWCHLSNSSQEEEGFPSEIVLHAFEMTAGA